MITAQCVLVYQITTNHPRPLSTEKCIKNKLFVRKHDLLLLLQPCSSGIATRSLCIQQ